jgi:glycosyltransferase involved in cell wall biosynthesis
VVPYGYETEVIARPPKELREMRPLRIATVGTVGLRKGTPYVLQAAKLLRGCAEFRIAGSIQVSERAKAELGKHLVLLGRIPRSQVRELYQWADLFLLPSICEGSATACYEALCHGVPVITTENAGSIVRHGTDGWIVPGRDAGAIAEVVRGVDIHRARLRDYSANALEQAKFLSLEKWSQRLVGALELAYKPIGHPQGRVAEHTGRNN